MKKSSIFRLHRLAASSNWRWMVYSFKVICFFFQITTAFDESEMKSDFSESFLGTPWKSLSILKTFTLLQWKALEKRCGNSWKGCILSGSCEMSISLLSLQITFRTTLQATLRIAFMGPPVLTDSAYRNVSFAHPLAPSASDISAHTSDSQSIFGHLPLQSPNIDN